MAVQRPVLHGMYLPQMSSNCIVRQYLCAHTCIALGHAQRCLYVDIKTIVCTVTAAVAGHVWCNDLHCAPRSIPCTAAAADLRHISKRPSLHAPINRHRSIARQSIDILRRVLMWNQNKYQWVNTTIKSQIRLLLPLQKRWHFLRVHSRCGSICRDCHSTVD